MQCFPIFLRLFINPQVLRMEHGTDMTDRSTNQPADGQNGSLGNYTYNLWKVCTFFCGRNLGWLQVFISSTNYKYFERYINNLEWYVLSSAVLKKENKKGWKKKDKGETKKKKRWKEGDKENCKKDNESKRERKKGRKVQGVLNIVFFQRLFNVFLALVPCQCVYWSV